VKPQVDLTANVATEIENLLAETAFSSCVEQNITDLNLPRVHLVRRSSFHQRHRCRASVSLIDLCKRTSPLGLFKHSIEKIDVEVDWRL